MFDNSDKRVRGAKGVAIRKDFLRRNPLCVKCADLGIVTAAEEVDHIQPLHAEGLDVEANKQALCKVCHKEKSAAEQGANLQAQMFPDWLEPALGDLTIVFGPPASGKTSYVRDRAMPGDLVIDLDQIKAEVSGMPIYAAGGQWLSRAVRIRNRMLGALKREARKAWFITSGTGSADRDWWAAKLKPTQVVVLDVPQDECISRIKKDARRPDSLKAAHIAAVRAWWAADKGFVVKTGRRPEIGLDGWPA